MTISNVGDQVLGMGILSRIIGNYLNKQLKPLGLNNSNYFFIFFIADHQGSSQDDLTKNMFLDHSTIARSVAKLVNLGLLEKRSDPNDKRTSRLYLTDKGQAAIVPLHELTVQAEQQAFGVLTEEERQTVLPLLYKAAKLNEKGRIQNANRTTRKNEH